MWLVDTSPTFGVDFGTASVGTVTVTITRADGTVLVTNGATTDNTDGTYSYELAVGLNTKLDRLRLDWKVVSTGEIVPLYEEIVRNLLFTIDQARNKTFTGQQTPISSAVTYPDAEISRMRELITRQFEEKTSHSWIRRYCRMEVTGTGNKELSLYRGEPRDVVGNELGGEGRLYNIAKITSATIGGVAVTLADLKLAGRSIIHTTGVWPWSADPFNIVIEYEYGDSPVDPEVSENGLRMVVANLVPSDVPAYTQNFTGQEGTITYPPGGLVWPPKTREWLDRNPRRRVPVAI